jgi:hypothetical protein
MRRVQGGRPPATSPQGEGMTYNRMDAKPRAGAQGRCWGEATAPRVKTPCGQQWIWCDTALVSLRGGGRCQVEQERCSLGDSH